MGSSLAWPAASAPRFAARAFAGVLVLARAKGGEAPGASQPADDAADVADVRRCLRGEAEAYRSIVARHQAMVSRRMWRFARDPEMHEELVQDVFVEAYECLRRFRATGPFAHWLSRIATRVGYRYWRSERRERATLSAADIDLDAIAEAPADDDPDRCERIAAALYRLLATLPPRDRLVLTLRYLEGHSVQETAKLAGWSETMVKVQALRARAKLKAAFERAHREDIP